MTAEELRKAELVARRRGANYDKACAARNALILAAIAEGWTHAQIAAATGMTRSRVGQIALRGG